MTKQYEASFVGNLLTLSLFLSLLFLCFSCFLGAYSELVCSYRAWGVASIMASISTAKASDIYRPLSRDGKEIRVAMFDACDDFEAPISAELHTISLTVPTVEPFEGLSYYWGDPTPTHPITLNGLPWAVPASVNQAIRHLRRRSDPKKLAVWIDNFCINQKDLDERAFQIIIMEEVYTKSTLVNIWLGVPRHPREAVAEIFTTLEQLSIGQKWSEMYPAVTDKDYHSGLRNSGRAPAFFHETFLEPWFDRLWTLQEAVLGKEVVIQWGENRIDLNTALKAYTTFAEDNLNNSQALLSALGVMLMMQVVNSFDKLRDLLIFRQLLRAVKDYEREGDEQAVFMVFAVILVKCRHRRSLDDRDKVYGTLGMVPPVVRKAVSPSYTESRAQVWSRTARAIIDQTQSYLIFSHICDVDQAFEDSPRWVPRWSASADWIDQYIASDLPRIAERHLFRACGNTRFDINFMDNGSTIATRGILIDRVVSLADLHDNVRTENEIFTQFQHLCDMVTRVSDPRTTLPIQKYYGEVIDDIPTHKQVWNIAFHDCLPDKSKGQDAVRRMAPAERQRLVDAAGSILKYSNLNDARGHKEPLSTIFPDHSARELYDHVRSCIRGRSGFVTEIGYVGISRAQSDFQGYEYRHQRDAYLFVLEGATHPVLLRAVKGQKDTFVPESEAWVGGLMDGEAVDGRASLSPLGDEEDLQDSEEPSTRLGDAIWMKKAKKMEGKWRDVRIL